MKAKQVLVECEECGSTIVEQVSPGIYRCLEDDCGEYFGLDNFEPYRNRKNRSWDDEDEY